MSHSVVVAATADILITTGELDRRMRWANVILALLDLCPVHYPATSKRPA